MSPDKTSSPTLRRPEAILLGRRRGRSVRRIIAIVFFDRGFFSIDALDDLLDLLRYLYHNSLGGTQFLDIADEGYSDVSVSFEFRYDATTGGVARYTIRHAALQVRADAVRAPLRFGVAFDFANLECRVSPFRKDNRWHSVRTLHLSQAWPVRTLDKMPCLT